MAFSKVSERVYADTVTPGSGNAGAILLDDRTIVVDAQYASLARSLRSMIEHVSSNRITHLFLTHSHSDHVFGNEVFQDCEIVAHESLKARMEELAKTSWSKESLQKQVLELRKTDPERAARFENVHVVQPTTTFDAKFVLGQDDLRVEMIHTGGHTADSSIVFFPRNEVVFAGDLIFCGIYPYGGDPTADPDFWVQALNAIRGMKPEVIVPGHGPLCGIEEIDRYTNYITETKSAMADLIRAGTSESMVITDPSLPPFYEEGADRRRASTLAQWYRIWRTRIESRSAGSPSI